MRRDRPVSGETTLTRMWVLSAVAVVLGLVGGAAAVALFKLISLMTHLTLLGDIGFDLPTLRGYHPTPMIVVYAVVGGLLVSVIALWSPVIRGHGIPESLEAILDRDSRIRPRAAVAKPLSAAITIGTGGPFGAEGPIIVTGGSVGSLIGQLLSVSAAERKIMLATGAAAGMSATFNTPVAAVILAIELVLFERSLRVIVPLSIASAVAAAIHIVAFGSEPLFMVAATLHVSFSHLPWFVLVGAASGLMAIVLNKGLFAMEAAFRRLPINIFWWPALGALGFALIGLAVPRTLSMGYSAIIDTLNGKFTLAMLGLLLVAKLASWLIALGSQTSGGTLAPMFLVGATMGAILGRVVNLVFPGADVSPSAFALVAMGATFGAATKALFAAVVFAAEVTGEYTMLVPLLLAAGVAELIVAGVLSDRLMTEKLSHRGFRVEFRTAVDALRTRVARQVMRDVQTVPYDADLGTAREILEHFGADRLAVVRDERYCGLISLAALEEHAELTAVAPGDDATVAGDLAGHTIEPIEADEYMSDSMERFLVHAVDALPVVDHGIVVGHLSREDLLAERYRRGAAQELRQSGWLSSIPLPWRRRSTASAAGPRLPVPGGGPAHSDHTAPARSDSPRMTASPTPARPESRVPRAIRHRLVPLPATLTPQLGRFVLSARSRIVVAWGSDEAWPVAERLAAELRPATGFRLTVSHGRAYPDDISLTLGPAPGLDGPRADEGYSLRTGVVGVALTAPTVRGLHHGIQTIRQLLPVWITSPDPVVTDWTIPAMTITDHPSRTDRPVTIDLTGAAVPDEVLLATIDRAADYKLNGVRLAVGDHYADRPAELPGYQAILARAAQRHMTVTVAAGGDAVPAAPSVLSVADGRAVLTADLLRAAEAGWSPSVGDAAPADALARFAAQGPRLALTGTVFDAGAEIPWRLHLLAAPGDVRKRAVTGVIGTLIAPGFPADELHVTVDWGDGESSAGRLVPMSDVGEGTPWYTVEGSHVYRSGGSYRIVLLGTALGAVPARASVATRVGSAGRLRLRRSAHAGDAPGLAVAGRDNGTGSAAGEQPGVRTPSA